MSNNIPEPIRKKIWDEKLTSELNYRYYDKLGLHYTRIDLWFKIILAVTSSTTVGFWLLVEPKEILWKSLSAISAIFAVISATINYQKKIEFVSKEKSSYFGIWQDLENLWLIIENFRCSSKKAIEDFNQINNKIRDLEKDTTFLPINEYLRKKSYQEVLQRI